MLSSCFGGYCQISHESNVIIPPTGGLDSIKISIDNVKTINKKLIEARFDKEKAELYKSMFVNDKIIIDSLTQIVRDDRDLIWEIECDYDKQVSKKKFWCGSAISLGVVLIIIIAL